MRVTDSESEGSSIAFLGGSYLWKDYTVRAEVRLEKTDSFSITTRYHDQNNYVSCVFSDHYVSLDQKINSGEVIDVRNSLETRMSSGQETPVGMSVSGDKASCFFNGKEVVSATIDPELSHGGVGFKVWDTTEKGSSLIVKNFKAEQIPAANFNQKSNEL
jgi:hypothetical protein